LAVILAFDVKESKEARDLADEMGVKIFRFVCEFCLMETEHKLFIIFSTNLPPTWTKLQAKSVKRHQAKQFSL
jgi:hypothetical protein